jgi:hypothetical protein
MTDIRWDARALRGGKGADRAATRNRHLSKFLIGTSLYALSIAIAPRALATCANGNGSVLTTGVCVTPQTLSSAIGTIVSGATLSTGTPTAG